MKITKENSEAFNWGQNCNGWHLVNTDTLSVIKERMPPGTEEVEHKHSKSQQFFFILQGQATFFMEKEACKVNPNEGIHVQPNVRHQIKNQTNEDLVFLVISQPRAHGDRIIEHG